MGGLYLGRRKGSELVYAGKVDHCFDNNIATDLQATLKPLVRKTQRYIKRIEASGLSQHCWQRSNIVSKPAEGKVCDPVFKELREICERRLFETSSAVIISVRSLVAHEQHKLMM
jgi:bifunctional non-homologous end joining protein LigD